LPDFLQELPFLPEEMVLPAQPAELLGSKALTLS
jgi:hypothetical protein